MRRLLLLSLLFPSLAFAQPDHPKIGLVLEGGGALGFAHVGVLKVLEEQRVPVHIVTGTSMGSIVGAAYASGRTVKEMEAIISSTDWDLLFSEAPPRRMVRYRNKSGTENEIFGDAKFGIKEGDVVVPTALVQGQYVEQFCQRLFGKVDSERSFDDLPVAYRAVAADLETGEAVVLSGGSLTKAARASMSVPGFFAPVELDGRLLVDGGITNNFPVDVAFEMGAEHIIGVQFENPLRTREALGSPLSISAQILDLLLMQTSKKGMSLMRPSDVLIEPDITNFSATSFNQAPAILKAGEDAARALIPQLKRFALSDAEYAEYSARRTNGREYAPRIQFVKVEGTKAFRAVRISDQLKDALDRPLNRDEVDAVIKKEFQTGEFEKIEYDVVNRDGKDGIIIRAGEKDWMKNFVRFGFSLEDDFDGTSNYSLAANSRLNDLNSWGAYFDTQLEIGRNPRVFGELYQPLGQEGLFFVAPEASWSRTQLTVRDDGEEIAEYFRESMVGGLKGGLALGRFGEFAVGVRRGDGELERNLGDPTLPEFDYDIGETFGKFIIDQLDNPDFPTEGYRLALFATASREGLGASDRFDQGVVYGSLPITFDRATFLLAGEAGASSDDLPVQNSYALGGLFNISGYKQGSLAADNYWVGRSMVYYRFLKGETNLFPFGGYGGFSFELASLRSESEAIGDNPDITAGSLFVGADTPLLPFYLAFGLNNDSESSIYLNVGRLNARRR